MEEISKVVQTHFHFTEEETDSNQWEHNLESWRQAAYRKMFFPFVCFVIAVAKYQAITTYRRDGFPSIVVRRIRWSLHDMVDRFSRKSPPSSTFDFYLHVWGSFFLTALPG